MEYFDTFWNLKTAPSHFILIYPFSTEKLEVAFFPLCSLHSISPKSFFLALLGKKKYSDILCAVLLTSLCTKSTENCSLC